MLTLLYLTVLLSVVGVSPLAGEDYSRTDKAFAQIGEPIGQLQHAVGWSLNEAKQWVKRENRIPCVKDPTLIDYEGWKLGVSNFTNINLRNISIGSKDYVVLSVLYNYGHYLYPAIHQNWLPERDISFFIINKEDLAKFQIRTLTPTTIELKPIYSGTDIAIKSINGLQEVKEKLNAILADTTTQHLFNTITFNLLLIDNNMRFTIISRDEVNQPQMDYFDTTYNSFGEREYISLELPYISLLQPDTFKNHYFETSAAAFKKFIPLIVDTSSVDTHQGTGQHN
jgi:hypothetical protein